MKRFLSMLFVLCMCLSCFGGFAAYAEEGAQIKVSAVNGFAGEEATVQISIENNPGIAYLKLKLAYDANVLTVKEASDKALMGSGTFNDTNPYIFVWSQAANCTTDGVLATLTFVVDAEAALGATALTVTIEEVRNQTFEELSASFATVNGSVTVKEPASTITSANVALGDTIAMNYFVELYPGHAGAQMKFTMNEKEVLVDGVATGEPYEYRYTFTGITPQCMGDTVLAELIYDGSAVASKAEYSVLENLQDLNGKTAVQLGYTDAQYAAMKTLIADLREYGAAAQVYTGHNINALVNDGNSGATAFVASNFENYKDTEGSSNASFSMTSAGLWFDYNNAIYVKFTAIDMDAAKSRVLVSEYDAALENVVSENAYLLSDAHIALVDAENSLYTFTMDGMSPLAFDTVYMIELQTKSGLKFNSCQYLSYSVNSFVSTMSENADVKVANLAKALGNYGLSAEAFANSFNG